MKYNYNYFKQIDTQNKAYFLGLFHADGSCTQRVRKNSTETRFQISLQYKDKEILEAFCKDAQVPLQRLKHYKSSRPNESDYVKLYLADKRFSTHLLDLKEPTIMDRIPKELIPHFIRGFFDGDGCIYRRGTQKKIAYYQASFTCQGWIKDVILQQFPGIKIYQDKRSEDLYELSSNKKSLLIFMFNYLYNNSNIKLLRKYTKFKDAYKYASTTIPVKGVESSDSKQEASVPSGGRYSLFSHESVSDRTSVELGSNAPN